MKDVKEALERAFILAKQQGVVLRRVEFESIVVRSSSRDKQFVQLTDIELVAVTMRSDQE